MTSALAELHAAAGAALQRFYAEFDVALRDARDVVGLALARCIQRIVADDLDIHTVAARFCEFVIERWPSDILPVLIEEFYGPTDRSDAAARPELISCLWTCAASTQSCFGIRQSRDAASRRANGWLLQGLWKPSRGSSSLRFHSYPYGAAALSGL